MDFKRKRKKISTLKNLDDLKKRSRSEDTNNGNLNYENTFKIKNKLKYNNELITCKSLTFSLFKKTISSKIVTRVPVPVTENTDNIKPLYRKTLTNILMTSPPQVQNSYNDMKINSENKMAFENLKDEKSFNRNVLRILYSPLNNGFVHFENSIIEDCHYTHGYLSNFSSCSNSETELGHCYYEKFMRDLPAYLKEHFPALNVNFLNENIDYLINSYLENGYEEKENNAMNCNRPDINFLRNHRETIIQNPMDYIKTGVSWDHSVKKKQNISLSNNSSASLYEFGSNISDMYLNSPDYQYFPHKLNQ